VAQAVTGGPHGDNEDIRLRELERQYPAMADLAWAHSPVGRFRDGATPRRVHLISARDLDQLAQRLGEIESQARPGSVSV
jgi:hypothetical protein